MILILMKLQCTEMPHLNRFSSVNSTNTNMGQTGQCNWRPRSKVLTSSSCSLAAGCLAVSSTAGIEAISCRTLAQRTQAWQFSPTFLCAYVFHPFTLHRSAGREKISTKIRCGWQLQRVKVWQCTLKSKVVGYSWDFMGRFSASIGHFWSIWDVSWRSYHSFNYCWQSHHQVACEVPPSTPSDFPGHTPQTLRIQSRKLPGTPK